MLQFSANVEMKNELSYLLHIADIKVTQYCFKRSEHGSNFDF